MKYTEPEELFREDTTELAWIEGELHQKVKVTYRQFPLYDEGNDMKAFTAMPHLTTKEEWQKIPTLPKTVLDKSQK